MTQQELESAIVELRAKVEEITKQIQPLHREQFIFSAWAKVVDTQMHFNDMVMRVRNLAITLILAAFGAAAYSVQAQIFVNVFGSPVHVSFFIIVFGLAGWVALWVMDLGHFHKLLRGAVGFGMDIEKEYQNDPFLKNLLGMTTRISKESREFMGYPIKAGKKLGVFYSVVFVIGLCFSIVTFNLDQKSNISDQPKEQILKLITDNQSGVVLRLEPPTIVLKEEVQAKKPSPKQSGKQ